MEPDHAAKVLAQTARREIRRVVGDAMSMLRTGTPREMFNPFTGAMQSVGVDPALKSVADRLESAGLRGDKAFMDALEKVMLDRVSAPVFSLFSAFDGGGSFADEDARFEIRDGDGGRVPSYLHEILYPIEADLLPSAD